MIEAIQSAMTFALTKGVHAGIRESTSFLAGKVSDWADQLEAEGRTTLTTAELRELAALWRSNVEKERGAGQ